MDNVHYKMAKMISELLDNKFRIGNFSFGLDPLLGLIPGFGDTVSLLLGWYLVLVAVNLGLSKTDLAKMMVNLIIDWVIGLIPFLGDISDFFFKSNERNMKIIDDFVGRYTEEGRIMEDGGES